MLSNTLIFLFVLEFFAGFMSNLGNFKFLLKDCTSKASYWDRAWRLSSLIALIPWIYRPSSKSISIFSKWNGVLLVLESWAARRSWVIGAFIASTGIMSEVIFTSCELKSET